VDDVRRIADAVLYEGYLLWPYRRSALKNQRRWTFGGVYPAAHSRAHPDDASRMRTEVLLDGDPADVDVTVRFLHVVLREDGWEEATERELAPGPIAIAAGHEDGRAWEALAGSVGVRSERVADGRHRVVVEIANTTPVEPGAPREAVLRRTFCSTHTVLHTGSGAFLSGVEAGDACASAGTWPVLVGEPGERHTLLSSPIILEDHPRIAPESPGDLFDGGEIDGLLTLSILGLTDAEKAEMRDTDPRVRAILERSESMSPEQLLRLSGYRVERSGDERRGGAGDEPARRERGRR
jgi:hydrogenase maturation protease